MKRALCLLVLPVLLSGCRVFDALEGFRQTDPNRSDYPVPFSERWFELRKEAKS